jgi:hypothetical protein
MALGFANLCHSGSHLAFLMKQFALLPPISFLTLMTHIPARDTSFELGTADHQMFEALRLGHSAFKKAMKLFAQRRPTKVDE